MIGRLFMQAIRIRYIYPLLLANCFLGLSLLLISLWDRMAPESQLCVFNGSSGVLVKCRSGIMDNEPVDGPLSETQVANYNQPPSTPGYNGLVILALLLEDKN